MSQIKQHNVISCFHYRDENFDEITVDQTSGGAISIQKAGVEIIRLSALNDVAAEPDIWFQSNGVVACESSLYINIDSNNDSTNAVLIVGKDAETNAATELMRIGENGRVGIGVAAPNNALDVVGTVQADGLRLDVTPTAETPSMTHTITISLNGTNYKIPCVAA